MDQIGNSDDGQVVVCINQGKHSAPPPKGSAGLIANWLRDAGFGQDGNIKYNVYLMQARKGSHATKGAKLGKRYIENAVIVNVQPGNNTTNREYTIIIPDGTGTAEEYRERMGATLNEMPEKQTDVVEELVLESDDEAPALNQSPTIEPEIVLLVIDSIVENRTLEVIKLSLYAEIEELRAIPHEDFEEHVIGPLLQDGLLICLDGVYSLSTAGKALLGPDGKVEAPDPVLLETPTPLMEKLASLEAIVQRASEAEKRLSIIQREISSHQAQINLLHAEAREIEIILNDSDIPATEAKLVQIRGILE